MCILELISSTLNAPSTLRHFIFCTLLEYFSNESLFCVQFVSFKKCVCPIVYFTAAPSFENQSKCNSKLSLFHSFFDTFSLEFQQCLIFSPRFFFPFPVKRWSHTILSVASIFFLEFSVFPDYHTTKSSILLRKSQKTYNVSPKKESSSLHSNVLTGFLKP